MKDLQKYLKTRGQRMSSQVVHSEPLIELPHTRKQKIIIIESPKPSNEVISKEQSQTPRLLKHKAIVKHKKLKKKNKLVEKLLRKKLKIKDSEKNLSGKTGKLANALGKLPKTKKEKTLKEKISQQTKANRVKKLKLKKKLTISPKELTKILPQTMKKDKYIPSGQEEIQNEGESPIKIIKKEKNSLNGQKFKVDLSLKSRLAVKALKKKGLPKKITTEAEMQERPIEEQRQLHSAIENGIKLRKLKNQKQFYENFARIAQYIMQSWEYGDLNQRLKCLPSRQDIMKIGTQIARGIRKQIQNQQTLAAQQPA